ncbi:hypothetical protein PMI28_04879, partial [Pseudomonas sp. GM48]
MALGVVLMASSRASPLPQKLRESCGSGIAR